MKKLLDFSQGQRPDPKMQVGFGDLPSYVDPTQPPTKKSPWRQIGNVPLACSTTMVLPDEMYQLVWNKIEAGTKSLRYAKVIMKLQDLLSGDFFTEYVKKGNILLLSEGQPGVDNVFSLRDGILRLDLDKDSHERAGLQGKVVQGLGRKHVKSRFLIEQDLRQPSMLHGKKGFERIVWAANNVLNHSVTWLFCNLNSENSDLKSDSPISKHHPTWVGISPKIETRHNVLVPELLLTGFHTTLYYEDQDTYYEIIEWLDLVALDSPLVQTGNSMDNLLCQYSLPEGPASPGALRVVRWHGLIPATWITDLLITTIRQSRIAHTEHWITLTTCGHKTEASSEHEGYTIILRPALGDDTANENNTTSTTEEGGMDSSQTAANTTKGRGIQPEKHHGGLRHYVCFEHLNALC